jgi:chromosome segregation ATPase
MKIETTIEEKKLIEYDLKNTTEELQSIQMEVSTLRHQLDFETKKNNDLNRERDTIFDKTEMDQLLLDARTEKEKFESIVKQLRDQLTFAEMEVKKLREQLILTESDSKDEINKLTNQMKNYEYKWNEIQAKNDELFLKLKQSEEAMIDAEMRAQRHLEDKRELKTAIGDKDRQLAELEMSLADKQLEIKEMKLKMSSEQEEWKRFQDDLLTTVRVANDFKQETIINYDKLQAVNKTLNDKLANLEVFINYQLFDFLI